MQRRLSVLGVCYSRRCATTGAGAWFMSELGFLIMSQTTEASGQILILVVRTWKYGTLFLYDLVSAVFTSTSGCCLWCTELWILWEMTLAVPQCLARRWIHVLRQYLALDELRIFSALPWTRILKCLVFVHAEWRRVLSRCFIFSPGCAARTRKSGVPFTSPTWLEVVMCRVSSAHR